MEQKKKNYRYLFILLLLIIIILFSGYTLYHLTITSPKMKLKKMGYSEAAITTIIEQKIEQSLIKNQIQSKTLEVALLENQFIKENMEHYVNIPYLEKEGFIYHLNQLIFLGYSDEQISRLLNQFNYNDLEQIIAQKNKIEDITEYLNTPYFLTKNLTRYTSLKVKYTEYSYTKTVSYVNTMRDYPFYTNTIQTDTSQKNLILVNKYYQLPNNYVPTLHSIDSKYSFIPLQATPETKNAFERMCMDAKTLGLIIKGQSAYRSYNTQNYVYWSRANPNNPASIAERDRVSARAGFSEHQTGLAIDVNTLTSLSAGSNEYKWYKDKAHLYGFIIRYPENKEDITGYRFEPWHLRYVGVDVATYIYNNNITFDEYYAYFIQ